MGYAKLISMCAAVAITAAGVFVMAPQASGKSRPIFVTGQSEVITRHVSYADLNLASAPGQMTLNRRVGGAVNGVCSEALGGDDGSVATKIWTQRCHATAWDGARPQIARAIQRAREIAFTGSSTLAATAIVIALPE